MTDPLTIDPAHSAPRPCLLDGELALEPSALGRPYPPSPRSGLYEMLFGSAPALYEFTDDGVAVVSIDGPLEQRSGWWSDGHDAVAERATAALKDPKVKAVVLRIDSPGGSVAGLYGACDAIRSAADAAGKPIVAHADEAAYSAAYALATCADAIHLPETGGVGSVGVLLTVYDRTAATEKAGLNVQVIRSGNQKADGHPDVPLTDAAVGRMRARVNTLASMFADRVAARRPGLEASAVLALQGACVYGSAAVSAGLADRVCSLSDSITTAAQMAADRRKNTMETKATETLTTLHALTGTTDTSELLATIGAWKASHEQSVKAGEDLAAVRKQLDARDRATLFADAARAGRWTPAMSNDPETVAFAETLPTASLKTYLSKLPAQIPAKPAKPDEKSASTSSASTLTAAQRKAAKQTGLTDEEFAAQMARDAKRVEASAEDTDDDEG